MTAEGARVVLESVECGGGGGRGGYCGVKKRGRALARDGALLPRRVTSRSADVGAVDFVRAEGHPLYATTLEKKSGGKEGRARTVHKLHELVDDARLPVFHALTSSRTHHGRERETGGGGDRKV